MNRLGTIIGLLALLLGSMVTSVAPTLAQPVRNGVDVIWARDVAGAEMTLDGMLDEAEWEQAESIDLNWNRETELPGSGQFVEGTPVPGEPPDPNNGTMRLLRDGNTLWLSLEVEDKSVGGGLGLWDFDGIIMAIIDRTRQEEINYEDPNNFIRPNEFFYTWWNPADTTDENSTYDNGDPIGSGQPVPGIEPRLFGEFGVGFNEGNDGEARSEEDVAVWDARATVDGIANDDTHGDDAGYVMEMRIDMEAMGYDFAQEGGDQVPFNIALQDDDYSWPVNQDIAFLSRVWWQNLWANNFNQGIAYIYGASDVTVDSGSAPEVTEPVFHIPNAGALGAPNVDGSLDEEVWTQSDTLFYLQYQAEPEVMDMNPGVVAPYFQRWFRPDINGDGNAAVVVDPSMARVKMLFEGTTLYLGVDVDDQAISGISGEGGRDGIRFTIRSLDSLNSGRGNALGQIQFDFSVDSTGAMRFDNFALQLQDEAPGAVTGGVSLKGTSTVADPTDVDEGYQMEIAIDLMEALGYPADLGDGRLWLSVNFFDGDFLESQEDSYATRTWIVGERSTGASLYGYLNAESAVAIDETEAEVPSRIRLRGNYPNPFNPTTTLRYALPQAGDVSIEVFNVLGQKIRELAVGTQAAGPQQATFDASGLGSGLYFYRISIHNAAGEAIHSSNVGRMMFVK